MPLINNARQMHIWELCDVICECSLMVVSNYNTVDYFLFAGANGKEGSDCSLPRSSSGSWYLLLRVSGDHVTGGGQLEEAHAQAPLGLT